VMDVGLDGQHVLITGSGSAGGIGAHVAKLFLKNGCKVTLHYHHNTDGLKELLESYPDRTYAVKGNASIEQEVVEAVSAAVSKMGTINILIANHATFGPDDVPIVSMSLEQWQQTIDTNLTGTFLFVREYLRQLKDHASKLGSTELTNFNASVVIVGSTAGKFGEAYHADYSASKSALMYGFLRSLKNEIVKIVPLARANCVAPGWVYTKMAEESIKRGDHFKALQTMPLCKVANVDEVGNAILVMSSGKITGHSTGMIFEVDGGMEGRCLNTYQSLHH